MEQYWRAVQARVCHKCIDGDRKGNCLLPADQSCALHEFLPQIIQTVNSLNSNSFDDYVSALRLSVCAHCDEQGADGVCLKRETVECALDRYYGLVIQVIEDTKAGKLIPAA